MCEHGRSSTIESPGRSLSYGLRGCQPSRLGETLRGCHQPSHLAVEESPEN